MHEFETGPDGVLCQRSISQYWTCGWPKDAKVHIKPAMTLEVGQTLIAGDAIGLDPDTGRALKLRTGLKFVGLSRDTVAPGDLIEMEHASKDDVYWTYKEPAISTEINPHFEIERLALRKELGIRLTEAKENLSWCRKRAGLATTEKARNLNARRTQAYEGRIQALQQALKGL